MIGDNRTQVTRHLVSAFTGEYKHAPMLGGNVRRMISGTPDPFWAGNVKSQLKECLVEAEKIRVVDGGIEVEIKNQ